MTLYKKKFRFNLILGLVLLILLTIIFFQSFFYPPRSDYWAEMFYSFHHLDEYQGHINWLHVLNIDPFERMRYQPLSHLIYYLLHLAFGANFTFYNIFNFIFYYLSAYLLYKFALNFTEDKFLTAIFVTFFVLLFSHIDIVLWSCHVYIIIGLCMFLIGFNSYIRFMETGKKNLLFLVIILFLIGLWCYETFFLWPFGIVFLSYIRNFRSRKIYFNRVKVNFLVLFVIYIIYLFGYIFTQSLGTYNKAAYGFHDFLNLKIFISSFFLTLFNILYNNIIVNLYPLITFPLKIGPNISMGGNFINLINVNNIIIFIGGFLLLCFLIYFYIYSYKKGLFDEIKIFSFFLFLIISEFYILSFCRTLTNFFEFSLTVFRYQYVQNALIILLSIFLFDKFFKFSDKKKKIVCIFLIFPFIINIYCIERLMNIYDYQLANLRELLLNVKEKIQRKEIDRNKKIYIPDNIPEYLPVLCWNIDMGERFMEGTYQWIFSKKEIQYFTNDMKTASWIIDRDNFKVIKKGVKKRFRRQKILSKSKSRQYIDLGIFYFDLENYDRAEYMLMKAIQMYTGDEEPYIILGDCYMAQGKYSEGEKIIEKVLEINPASAQAYRSLGYFYKEQGKYLESEQMFRKSIVLNPNDYMAFAELGHIYNENRLYKDAEQMFKKVIEYNSGEASVYHGLGSCYRDQGKYKKAELMFKKAIEIDSSNDEIYVDLGHLYNEQGRYQDAEQMFKKALEINPENNNAYSGLEECYRSQGKF